MDLNRRGFVNYLLLPISAIFYLISIIRRYCYQLGLFNINQFDKPVIVVGNITAGGSGKTPIVIALCNCLNAQGKKVGVVSRGYGGSHTKGSVEVTSATSPSVSGDEPLLIKLSTNCVVMVNRDRSQAVNDLLTQHDIDVVVSDDGLQHYAMGRDVEICVIDGNNRIGNGFYLPSGMLRESTSRLKSVDFIINNGSNYPGEFSAKVNPIGFVIIITGEKKPLDFFHTEYCHGVAGIGNPSKFFSTLKNLHIHVQEHSFADHYAYQKSDLEFKDNHPIIMTSKDWVKCREFANDKMYYLDIDIDISEDFFKKLLLKL